MSYDLYYWPMGPGRGEYPRLVLEAAEVAYRDVARLAESEGGGMKAMTAFLSGERGPLIPFAPPFLIDGDLVISQAAETSAYLGEKHGLAPLREADRQFARSIAFTTADLVAEAHDVHHPVGTGLYYEDQKSESKRRAEGFRNERIPKFLGWYEKLLSNNPEGPDFLVGDRLTYADLGLFQTWLGLEYAFPRRMANIAGDYPKIRSLVERVSRHEAVAAYLASERRLPFNESGIFRHYPELDAE
ncbi:glutathione S-transferase [Aurantimonas sp. VKM B-3413]|uniref:glutathione S-transferase n=1 Tax=Aurantimonas sp. VKM B-3413 TaxID=2779401 RepID=UPI001E425315|nr:glutathione S-transferase [Aurantimonas sp. VKM B-3413]MCB8837052.1 glutathione S-transferase [Aurantimonas sp. VKM B-3413]